MPELAAKFFFWDGFGVLLWCLARINGLDSPMASARHAEP